MSDFETGQLVGLVTELNKEVSKLTLALDKIEKRLAEQELQLAKGKGMAAGAIALAAVLGGISAYFMGKIG